MLQTQKWSWCCSVAYPLISRHPSSSACAVARDGSGRAERGIRRSKMQEQIRVKREKGRREGEQMRSRIGRDAQDE